MASHNRTHASDRGKAVVDIPGIPTIGTATAGAESATVEFTANVKGGAATTWTALSNPGSITGTGSSSPVTVTGLTAGTSYTFTVRGANATGNGEYSAASNSIIPTVGTSYESIATVTVGAGGSSSILFTSIPSTFKHLQIRMFSIGNGSAFNGGSMYFNGDTSASNYYSHYIIGNGSSITVGANQDTYTPFTVGVSASPAVGIVDILDYADTNKRKVSRELNGYDANGSGRVNYNSVLWNNTSAITQIALNFSTFQQNTQFALYGIKG